MYYLWLFNGLRLFWLISVMSAVGDVKGTDIQPIRMLEEQLWANGLFSEYFYTLQAV
jgi:hypothetical protein